MDISIATTWWIVAGIAVAAELATGTFYLLMIALGLVAGALAAHFGFGLTLQVLVAAVIGCAATGLLHWRRSQLPAALPAASDRDVNLDIGQEIRVGTWGVDHTAKVHYRGSLWSAKLAPGAVAAPGVYRVSAVEGNWLVLAPA
jgi:membrane protein implicated in regulation of membrane protease activity